jgi:hypothetical protein
MSSPFDAGRDSNAAMGNAFGDYHDGQDSHLGEVVKGADWTHDNLSEKDYRDSDHKP